MHADPDVSRNRLNVAISRAENVAIIIFNEKLLLASANSIEEMKLMNEVDECILRIHINMRNHICNIHIGNVHLGSHVPIESVRLG